MGATLFTHGLTRRVERLEIALRIDMSSHKVIKFIQNMAGLTQHTRPRDHALFMTWAPESSPKCTPEWIQQYAARKEAFELPIREFNLRTTSTGVFSVRMYTKSPEARAFADQFLKDCTKAHGDNDLESPVGTVEVTKHLPILNWGKFNVRIANIVPKEVENHAEVAAAIRSFVEENQEDLGTIKVLGMLYRTTVLDHHIVRRALPSMPVELHRKKVKKYDLVGYTAWESAPFLNCEWPPMEDNESKAAPDIHVPIVYARTPLKIRRLEGKRIRMLEVGGKANMYVSKHDLASGRADGAR